MLMAAKMFSVGDYSALDNNTPTIADARASTTEQTEEDQRKRKASETIETEGKRPRRQRVSSLKNQTANGPTAIARGASKETLDEDYPEQNLLLPHY